MKINFFRIESMGMLSGINNYQDEMEALIIFIKKAEMDKILSQSNYDDLDVGELHANIDGARYEYEYNFPKFFRYSYIVLLFMITEKLLVKICNNLELRKNIQIGLNQLNGGIVERSKTYIHKLAMIDTNLNWTAIEELSIVRNCIVHTLGEFLDSRNSKRIKDLIELKKGLSHNNGFLLKQDELYIEQCYCKESAIKVRDFFNELFDLANIVAMTE